MALQSSGHHGGELSQTSQALLDKLDELLVDCKPKEVEDAHGRMGGDYIAGLNELKRANAGMEKKVKFAITDKACQILTESQVSNSRTSASEPFRILSIGCGDGIFDAIILQAMISKHPDIKLDYLGIDIDEGTCQKAREELSVLKKTSDKVKIRILKMDMHSLTTEISASCDLVLAIHSLYYAIDLRKVLTDVHALLKTDGCMLILLASQDYPALNYPYCRFWLHEQGWPIKLSDVTEESLDALGIKYTTEVICAELDLTECFRDGFQKPHQKVFLDFLTHTRLERYPPAVSQLCIEFLGSIAIGQPKECVIPISNGFIVLVQLTSDPAIAMALKPGKGGLDPSSRALLDKLDERLVGCIPKKVENAHGVDYTVGLDELKKACASHMNKAEKAVAEKASQVLTESQASTSSAPEPFRILSIGCGDGTFDAKIIQAMIRKHPDVNIHYMGIDIDKGVCDRAKEEVGALKANCEVEIKMIAMDFKDIDSIKAEIPPADLVLAVHSFYYMKDLRKALTDAQVLTKADHGRMFILLTNPNSPKTQLFHRFYLHEHGWPQKFSDVAMETLDSLGIEYTMESIDGELDFTECFRDRFQKPHQRFLLDFMTHTKTERYPAEISQLCIEFLSSAAIGKPDRYIIPFSVAFIVSKKNTHF